MKWKKFDENRNFKIINKVLIVKPSNKEITPLFCPICNFAMKTSDDFLSFKDYQCCDKCKFYFVAPNLEKWNSGWRPKKKSTQLKEYTNYRNQSFKPIIRFS
jgi:hypothetical protein